MSAEPFFEIIIDQRMDRLMWICRQCNSTGVSFGMRIPSHFRATNRKEKAEHLMDDVTMSPRSYFDYECAGVVPEGTFRDPTIS